MIIKFAGSRDEKIRDRIREMVSEGYIAHHDIDFCEPCSEEQFCTECEVSIFKDDTEIPMFEQSRHPDEKNPKYVLAKVCIDIDDFIRLSADILGVSTNDFLSHISDDDEQIERIKEGILDRHTVPIPVIALKPDGTLEYWQEGRHRAIAAKQLYYRCMPVYIAYKVK